MGPEITCLYSVDSYSSSCTYTHINKPIHTSHYTTVYPEGGNFKHLPLHYSVQGYCTSVGAIIQNYTEVYFPRNSHHNMRDFLKKSI